MGVFYKDKKMFGFDIGRSSIKIMQVDQHAGKSTVTGYGATTFDPSAIEKGVIVDHEVVVKAAHKLISHDMVGALTTTHAAVSLPNEHSFSRIITLPKMDKKDLAGAVSLEVDQSIPLPADELYYDYSVVGTLEDGSQEIQIVACPKAIPDSYVGVFQSLDLDIGFIESNISAVTRIVMHAESHDVGTLIVDIGSTACDISVYDGSAVRATGTVDCSSEAITANIAKKLNVTSNQANSIKTRYGLELSKKQDIIISAVEPELTKLINEIRKVVRYLSDKDKGGSQIGQIIILGGGANLPGLSGYITDRTRIATRLCAPWNNVSFGRLQPPHELETTLYTTASGLSMVTPKELTT